MMNRIIGTEVKSSNVMIYVNWPSSWAMFKIYFNYMNLDFSTFLLYNVHRLSLRLNDFFTSNLLLSPF